MKAKEYFNEFKKNIKTEDPNISIVKTFNSMFLEAKKIADMRNVKRNDGFISIFNEINDKANSFGKMVNKLKITDEMGEIELKHNSFKIYVKKKSPEFAVMLGWDIEI